MREEHINDIGYSMKVLSRLSEAFSQDSRMFALHMGRADEHAAKVDPDPTTTAEATTTAATTTTKSMPPGNSYQHSLHRHQHPMVAGGGSHHQHHQRGMPQMPVRRGSPRSTFTPPRRNLNLSGPPGAGDFRHYC
jgi:hypothetical protein